VTCNFDEFIDRCNTDSSKWCRYEEEVLPLWVADMDFLSPQPVIRALRERVDHGIFGYGGAPEELYEVVRARLADQYDWHVTCEDIFFVPGVVTGFNMACHAMGAPGDEILVETPAYPPMLSAPGNADQVCRTVSLVETAERYEHDFDAFEAAINERTSLFLFCNPHNPVGRIYEQEELERLAEICLRHDLIICSDEIHCDFVFDDHQHIPIAALFPEIAAQTATFFAPSKTFNIAGLKCSVGVVQNPELRQRIRGAGKGLVPSVNILGYTAALAAYSEGHTWLADLLAYLEANRDYLLDYVGAHMPSIACKKPEGTFLAWLDCRETGIPGNPHEFFLEHAQVALNDGLRFGEDGRGFVRLNFGCPRATLTKALDQMRAALATL
jgi:cystathionine beta-lyase